MSSPKTRLKIVTFTTLYPSKVLPRHGIFVEERLKHLLETGRVDATVIVPVPWFPLKSALFGEYGMLSRIPETEQRLELTIRYPRYLTIPKIGMTIAPLLLSLSLLRCFRRLKAELGGAFIIDAHYLYPDGVAACLLGKWLNVPVVMTARGSDLTLIPDYLWPRKMISWAISSCSRLVTVSESLRSLAIGLGAAPAKVITLRNGVDLRKFQPATRQIENAEFGSGSPRLLSVGHLVDLKGHDVLIEAVATMKQASLIIIGEGPSRKRLDGLIDRLRVKNRVSVLKNIPQDRLIEYYNSADILVLPSRREGMPNVVLESLGCGTPVVATNVGGIAELINCPEAGVVIEERTPKAVAAGIEKLLANFPDQSATRAHAKSLGWKPTISGLLEVFEEIS